MGITVTTQKPSRRYPSQNSANVADIYANQMKDLVTSHRKIKGQVLHLAIWYKTDDPKDLFLFEMVEGFPHGNGDPELFTVEFASSDKFPIARKGKLYLTLVNPGEAITAFEESWRGTQGIRASLTGQF